MSTSALQDGPNTLGGSARDGVGITERVLIATEFVFMVLLGLIDLWISSSPFFRRSELDFSYYAA